ncbi:MAG: hypothetical protein R3E95_17080 [Thiolinea sp.]
MAVNTEVTHLQQDKYGMTLLDIRQGEQSRTVQVQGGVILASGGFGRDPDKRNSLFPNGMPPYSPAAPGSTGNLHTGDGTRCLLWRA